jgi:hypothetical protein
VNRGAFGRWNVISKEELHTRIHTTKILRDRVVFGDRDEQTSPDVLSPNGHEFDSSALRRGSINP